MIVQCPQCGKQYRLEESSTKEDLRFRCTACKTVFSAVPASPPEEVKAAAGAKRILVCDDAPFFRTMLEDILTEAGFAVHTVANGEEALNRMADGRPDLLVLDLQMPGIGGLEVIKRVRQDDELRELPILAVSGVYTDSSDMMELEDAGADDYIGKKFKPEHLIRRVRKLLHLPPEAG